jgi:hypothetical protein
VLRFDLADRRRVVVATAITVIALPSLWLMNRGDGSTAPNVATAGVAVAEGAVGTPPAARPATDPMAGAPSPYLDGPARTTLPKVIEIAVPSDDPASSSTGVATYRSSLPSADVCFVASAEYGSTITVTNVDNSRSITCRVTVTQLDEDADIVLHTQAFAAIADITDAPVPVAIDW